MLLAIDTSAGQCAVALTGGGRVHTARREMVRGHGEHLFLLIGEVLAENKRMLRLAKSLGFESCRSPEVDVIGVRLKLPVQSES